MGPLRMTWSLGTTPSGTTADVRVRVEAGERSRSRCINATPIWHPMHVHGHTFRGQGSPRGHRDRAAQRDRHSDNLGAWMMHCHNLYHSELGMIGHGGLWSRSG
ncbi:multicopper oxidase domain-containing protein [Nonomuraea sp. NPDC059194]|uniref:multicopper oxidase domain-containing protein n=1 Tax=Nonomuraea sp. NPDC059194 TaxID=3346764 RepID=UPI003678BA6D